MKSAVPETPPDFDQARILERPDGFYWQDIETDQAYGPFPTLAAAVADMEYSAESAGEDGDALREAEDAIGMADWIDPETGEPAEEQVPHIEDH